MRLTTVTLQHFRNHLDSTFEFGEGTNVLLGDNGHGKTNVIEAISYLCLTKSFFAGSDALVLNFDNDMFEVKGTILLEHGIENHIRVAYDKVQSEKVFMINRKRVEPFSSVIGKFPVVICSPEHTPITMGSPGDRRKFIDFVISQSSEIYFKDLLEYRRVLKHRNRILFDAKISRSDCTGIIEPWDEQLLKYGKSLMWRRNSFIQEFGTFITSAYHQLVGAEEEPTIEYKPSIQLSEAADEQAIEELLRTELNERSSEEKRTGSTLVGPHRDEVLFKINGLDLRKYASQGQHKTFLVALKAGEFFYLKERCNETPILLLDDIFSELDEHRAEHLLKYVGELSQTFITSTNPQLFENTMRDSNRNKTFFIRNGKIVQRKTFAAA